MSPAPLDKRLAALEAAGGHVGHLHTPECPGGCRGLAFVKGRLCDAGAGA